MHFEPYKTILYSDTLLPDIFITEYMPSMDGDFVKVYAYCLFLSKHGKQASIPELSKNLGIEVNRVKDALTYLENVGVISRNDREITMVDLKEKEINKIYRLKSTSTPEEAIHSSERNKRRNETIRAINNTFFQGVMSPSWYTDIDAWFDKYKFEEDVMYALFQHCYDHKGLSKPYIVKVADNWSSKGIRNSFDLDRYFIEYQKLKDIRLKIVKKLKRQGLLTEYEEEYIEKWVMEFNYGFDIIELALKRTTSIPNPNFEYINRILSDWHSRGLRSKEEIAAYEKNRKQKEVPKREPKEPLIPQRGNFEQRKYDYNELDKLYKV